jgi:hypothetical protein
MLWEIRYMIVLKLSKIVRLRDRTTTLLERKVIPVKVDAFLPHLSADTSEEGGLLLMRMNSDFFRIR